MKNNRSQGAIQLKGITWDHERGYAPLQYTTDVFQNQNPEIRIKWEKRSLRDFGDYSISKLAKEYDILLIDHPFLGEAYEKELLVDYEKCFSRDVLRVREEQEIGKSYRCYNYEGKQMAFGVDAAALVAAVREDLFQEQGLQIPVTLEDVFELEKKLDQTLKIALPLCPTDCWCIFLSLGASVAGDEFITRDDGIHREAAMWALETVSRLYEIADKRSIEWNPIEALERMSNSNEILYMPFCFGYVNYSLDSRKVPVTFYNAPLGKNNKEISVLGGVGIAVSAQSKKKEEALKYIEYVTRPEIQKSIYFLSGGQPGQRDAWESKENNEKSNYFFSRTIDTIQNAYLRPRYPKWNKFQEQGGYLINQGIRTGTNPSQTAAELNRLFKQFFTANEKGGE